MKIKIAFFSSQKFLVLNMDDDETNCNHATVDEVRRMVSSSLHLNVQQNPQDETTAAGNGCGGSDSGVDVTPAVSCDSSLASGCYDPCKSPLGPSSPIENGSGPSSLPCNIGGSYYRPTTPTWRRSDRPPCSVKPSSISSSSVMSSSFHFESIAGGSNRHSPLAKIEPKKTDLNTVAKQSKVSTVKKLVNTYDMAKSLDRYATLPRRKRRSKENLTTITTLAGSNSNNNSGTSASVTVTPPREPSLNRAASLRRKHIEQGALAQNAATASTSPVSTPVKSAFHKATRPPPVAVKTKIYHEVCSQTYLTSDDITNVLSGNVLPPVENRVETNDVEIQVRFMFLEILMITIKFQLLYLLHLTVKY